MNLIIGDTSQLSHYFPSDYHRLSSRYIDINKIKKGGYDSVYILFAEQRTFLNETEDFFINVNVNKTISIINEIKNFVKKIVIYSTSELWNNYDAEVIISDQFNYNYTPYIKSKEILSNIINYNRTEYSNVIIIYPFNFNSPYRKSGFLFSKIFDSLLNRNKNSVGNLNFYRDLIHPKIIVDKSIETTKDLLIGCGELINVEGYVKDIFNVYNLNYKDYILTDENNNLPNFRKNYFSGIKYSSYNDLLKLTIDDIKNYSIS